MANGYMPRGDLSALAWMKNFVARLQERPGVYKVTPEELAQVADAVAEFVSAKAACTPETRSRAGVLKKDAARAAAEVAGRPVYARIKADASISAVDKTIAGVRVPLSAGVPLVGPPDEAPVLSVRDRLPVGQLLLVSRPVMGAAKPHGAASLQVWRAVGPSAEPERLEYFGTFTRGRIAIDYTTGDDLKVATYQARWMSRRGEPGPWSRPVSARVICSSMKVGQTQMAA